MVLNQWIKGIYICLCICVIYIFLHHLLFYGALYHLLFYDGWQHIQILCILNNNNNSFGVLDHKVSIHVRLVLVFCTIKSQSMLEWFQCFAPQNLNPSLDWFQCFASQNLNPPRIGFCGQHHITWNTTYSFNIKTNLLTNTTFS